MTFTEYINQADPQKLNWGSVIVREKDCVSYTKLCDEIDLTIQMGDNYYRYVTRSIDNPPGSSRFNYLFSLNRDTGDTNTTPSVLKFEF